VVAQREIAHKTNEITAFALLLDEMDLTGILVSADQHRRRPALDQLQLRSSPHPARPRLTFAGALAWIQHHKKAVVNGQMKNPME
jgi:hypothetical protein